MPRSSSSPPTPKGGRKSIKPGTIYGPYTVGEVVRSKVVTVRLRINTYAVTCKCGRRYEKSASMLGTGRKLSGCVKCVDRPGLAGKKVAKTDRNAAIVADRKAGMPLAAVAEKYGITSQRACQIIKREAARA